MSHIVTINQLHGVLLHSLCLVFDTTVNFFEPITNDVTIVAGEGTVLVRLTLRWPAVPLSVVDIEGNQVGQSVRIKINCAVSGYASYMT